MILSCCVPEELDEVGRARFIEFVADGGEVNSVTLPTLVDNAALLVMLFAHHGLIGTAAVKRPFVEHQRREFAKAGVADLAEFYPFELGWVVVHCDQRKQGHGRRLVAEAARRSPDGTYATTKTNAMHPILEEAGFTRLGRPYRSVLDRGSELCLFGLRAP